MKRPSLKLSVLIALVLLQCVASQQQPQDNTAGGVAHPDAAEEPVASAADVPSNIVPPQQITSTTPPVVQPTSNPPVEPTSNPTTTSNPPPPTTTPPVVQPTTTSDAPVAPPTSNTPPKTSDKPQPSSGGPAEPSGPVSSGRPNASSIGPGVPSATPSTSGTGTAPTASPTDPGNGKKGDNTATIAGSVVGGIVGLAFIAGLITWLNRRGGCTSRTRRRDQQDFDSHDNEYDLKTTENHNMGTGGAAAGAGLGMVAAGGAMQSSDNLPPSPFQHARRFVPPTSNPNGYMNLTDEEYGYHHNNVNYQNQGYQDYNNAPVVGNNEYDYQQHSHSDYSQDYQQDYYGQQQSHPQEYGSHDMGVAGAYQQQGYYNHAAPGSNVTSPTLVSVTPNDTYRQQLKPDQIDQKPNAA